MDTLEFTRSSRICGERSHAGLRSRKSPLRRKREKANTRHMRLPRGVAPGKVPPDF
jgi:hypothetical protein